MTTADDNLAFSCPELVEYARKSQSGVTLSALTRFGSAALTASAAGEERKAVLQAAQFLHAELPVRLAHRALDLSALPYGLANVPQILKMQRWYVMSFRELRESKPPVDEVSEAAFTTLLRKMHARHTPTLVTTAHGLLEFRKWMRVGPHETLPGTMEGDLTRFLERFFLSRIGLRLLIEQHLALRDQCSELDPSTPSTPRPPSAADYVGVIARRMQPMEVARAAVEDARLIVERAFGVSPDVEVHGDESFTFPYIPSHLHHMLFELTKNSLRAVVEAHGEVVDRNSPVPLYREGSQRLPPVVLSIGSGKRVSDVSFRVSDRGGGMSRANAHRAFSFFYTTYSLPTTNAGKPIDLLDDDYGNDVPVAGLGVGLPMSRLYARYFGGDLRLSSMEGLGTDAFLWLRRLGDANEPIFATNVVPPAKDTSDQQTAELLSPTFAS